MYALSFDMRSNLFALLAKNIADLKEHYGEPYHGAYYDIKRTLVGHGFYWIQGSTYMTNADNLLNLFNAINALKDIEWFRLSVRDIRGYRVEEWSDFTDIVKKGSHLHSPATTQEYPPSPPPQGSPGASVLSQYRHEDDQEQKKQQQQQHF